MVTGSDQWLERLQVLAKELRASSSGSVHADQLEQLLETWETSRAALDQDFMVQVSFFLGSLSSQVDDSNITALIKHLMQTRKPAATASSAKPKQNPQWSRTATSPPPPASPPSSEASSEPTEEVFIDFDHPEKPEVTVVGQRPPAPPKKDPGTPRQDNSSEETGPGYPEVERRVNSAYRLHLDRKHGEIEKLQELLAQKAHEAMEQNKEFGAMLRTERSALEQANSVTEINDMKQILIGGTNELLAGQKALEDKLRSSFEYLQVIKDDSEQLHDELNKVRLLSMTDENTGLPNRRAFLRRLEDEIKRAQQYDLPFTLSLIDLDFFKEINDKYGHPAGDEVLNWYAKNALPIFRHYDMVSRYGGEEFAVLFPGTSGEGAKRAMEKMRNETTGKTCLHEGIEIDIPTFSAGLATYRDREDETSIIKRADQALYRAKSLGRNRTVLEQRLPPVEDATGREP